MDSVADHKLLEPFGQDVAKVIIRGKCIKKGQINARRRKGRKRRKGKKKDNNWNAKKDKVRHTCE